VCWTIADGEQLENGAFGAFGGFKGNHYLQRNIALQVVVPCQPDGREPAKAKLVGNLIPAIVERIANYGRMKATNCVVLKVL